MSQVTNVPVPVLDSARPPSPGAPAEFADEDLDVLRLVAALRRRLRLFLAVFASVMLVTLIATHQITPKYTATAKVMLDSRKQTVTNIQDVLSDLPPDSAVVDTQVEILQSSRLAARVVDDLHLDQDPEFNRALRRTRVPLKLSPLAAQKQREAVVHTVMDGLAVKRVGSSYVMNVSYTSKSPAKAAAIANKFAELYVLQQLETKFDATRQVNSWLNSRLSALRKQVETDDAAVQQYKIANNLLSASGTNLTEQEISTYNQSLGQAQAQLAEDQARLNTARAQLAEGSTGEDVGEALGSPVVQKLREQRAEISAKVADLQTRYGDRHPELRKAQHQMADIDVQIQAEIQRIISNLQAKTEVSRQRAGAIAASISAAKTQLASNNRAMVRLSELQRSADASRALYDSYLTRFKETSSPQAVGQSDASIVAPADLPLTPSSPKTSLNLVLGFLLALGAGVGSAALAARLDASLATGDDVQRRVGGVCLGAIPLFKSVAASSPLPPHAYIVQQPLSSFTESFRHLLASIRYSRGGEPVQVVAITSALPDEGKTTTSVCLGQTAALQGAKVLVIDCDLRQRKLRPAPAEAVNGLLEVLDGEVTLNQAIVVDEATGAHFLLLTRRSETPKDVFGGPAMDRLLATARRRYDFIILDTAPILPVADTRVLAPKSDAVVFLAHWRKTPAHAIRAALRQLDGSGARVAGVVLTRVDMKQQAKHGYGDVGYYHTIYHKYYAN